MKGQPCSRFERHLVALAAGAGHRVGSLPRAGEREVEPQRWVKSDSAAWADSLFRVWEDARARGEDAELEGLEQ